MKLVIERHEKFFLSLYNELKSFYPQIDVLPEIVTNDYPRAIEAEYYQWLHKFFPPDEPRAIHIDALVEYREEIANTPHILKSKISSKNEYTLQQKLLDKLEQCLKR